ncbi:MAG: glutaredoxin family protein [Solirubrobacteraceae bacterium]
MPDAVAVTLLTEPACGYCEDAKAILARLSAELPLRIAYQDLGSQEGQRLARDAGILLPPGILIDGEPFSYGRPSERKLRRELRRRLAA